MTHAISTTNISKTRPLDSRPNTSTIAFVGSPLTFSDRMLNVLKAEFAGLSFVRYATVSDIAVAGRLDSEFSFVIFDEGQMDLILQNPKTYCDAVKDARIVVAYFDALAASDFLNQLKDVSQLGDLGLLPLNTQLEVWLSVMRLLLCGERYIPQDVFQHLNERHGESTEHAELEGHLTSREWQVLELVANGVQNKNIAADLSLSVHTVKLHIHNILKKTGVANRTCAANWFLSSGRKSSQSSAVS